MKNNRILIHLFVFSLFTVLQGSCKPEPFISLQSEQTINFTSDTSSSNIAFNTNCPWVAIPSADWIEISPSSGQSGDALILVSVKSNSTYDQRDGIITIVAENAIKTINVIQSQLDELLIEQTEYFISETGGTISVKVSTNTPIDCKVLEDADPWITIEPSIKALSEKAVSMIVTQNDLYTPRSGKVSITGGGKEQIITITQAPKKLLIIEQDEYIIEPDGGTVLLKVKSNLKYTASVSDDALNWLVLEEVRIEEDVDVYRYFVGLNFSKTTRIGTVTFKWETIEATATIQQKPLQFFDLSSEGTSNSYIVPIAGFYSFNAAVIGNGKEGIINNTFHTNDPSIEPKSVRILWQQWEGTTTNGQQLINAINLENGEVLISVNDRRGNALIAAYNDEECAGDIIWSWHIWRTEIPEIITYVERDGTVFDVMDRNLGAIAIKDYGFQYQWGRKDPLSSGGWDFRPGNKTVNSIIESIRDPLTPFSNNTTGEELNWDWLPKGSIDRWSNKKTIYDPCPPGYKVPPATMWDIFYAEDYKTKKGMERYNYSGQWDFGWNMFVSADMTTTTFYPKGTYWSSSPHIKDWAAAVLSVDEDNIGMNYGLGKSFLYTTRCIKEKAN